MNARGGPAATIVEHTARMSTRSLAQAMGLPRNAAIRSVVLSASGEILVSYTTTEKNGVFYLDHGPVAEEHDR